MKSQLINVTESIAYATRISQVNSVSHYRAPYLSEISNSLSKLPIAHFESDSFNAAMNSALGSEIAGKRAMMLSSIPEGNIAIASYMRLPIVSVNISRPLGTFSIKHDHSDIMAVRDHGAMIFMPESNLETIECIVQAYKVGEDPKVLLPSIVNIDLPTFSESAELPSDQYVKRFLSTPKLPFGFGKKFSYFAVPDDNYAELKKQQQKAMKNAFDAISSSSILWKKNFKREMMPIEEYNTQDAETILVISGYHSTTAKAACDNMRKEGKKVGVLRLRILRPWPSALISTALKGAKKVAIFDQSASIGKSGPLYDSIKQNHHFCTGFINLGNYPSEKTFMDIFRHMESSPKEETIWL